MKILKQNQYNQGIGKYKLLSSASGVGAIITTKHGFYILISDINKWKFVHWSNEKVKLIRKNNTDDNTVYINSKIELGNRGLDFINDKRFVDFLKLEKGMNNLVCLIGIPNMALNETFNTPNWKYHPINLALQRSGDNGFSSDYMIRGNHFPTWFKNGDGELRTIKEWKELWENECKKQGGVLKMEHFAPPRDAGKFVREFFSKDESGASIKMREYKVLDQTNLVLICPNGHLSDIPWAKFLYWKLKMQGTDTKGEQLLSYQDCCTRPKLVWTENKNKSEGYSSIFIHCDNCGAGRDQGKVNLEGINGLEPFCPGQKPWEQENDNNNIPTEKCFLRGEVSQGREKMRVSLVTANSIYYASGFSSLFIPMHLAVDKSQELIAAMTILNKKYQKYFEKIRISKNDYWVQKFNSEDFLIENDIKVNDEVLFIKQVEKEFLADDRQSEKVDSHENYRWQEYQCFVNNQSIPNDPENNGLMFNDIKLPTVLNQFFSKIKQVEELKITNVQLDFTRVRAKERIVVNGEPILSSTGQDIFSIDSTELFVLPSNETFGEGIFFQFNETGINSWLQEHSTHLSQRFSKYLDSEPDLTSQGAGIKRRIFNNKIKHFLIHSFSHMLMKELEFSCGYPTASLKERLYISQNPEKNMSGILIFTAEGAEGSMGGLVSQGEPDGITNLIRSGLDRAINCSSDPLCWESEGQGIFDLNLAACFSCSLVSETACEEMNLGLDRRVLIDEQFGFFNSILDNIDDSKTQI